MQNKLIPVTRHRVRIPPDAMLLYTIRFDGYSQSGLAGAGEWHELKKLLPDFEGKTVLDLGCGYGWHCKYAADHGAAYVLGTDISQRMLETARERNPGSSIEYRRAAMEDLDFPANSFDVVLSSLAFQ